MHAFHSIPRLIAGAISIFLAGLLAVGGAFTGAVMGALAGRASNCGVLRGAGLGALAGAVVSVEVLEASRAYWRLEQSGSRGTSSMADFMEQLLRARLMEDEFTPTALAAYHWQMNVPHTSYDGFHDTHDEVASRGLSGDSLKKLPFHVIVDKTNTTQDGVCTICLQDIEIGESARSLPKCHHTFHLSCVDKWLVRHGSCPVCRQDVYTSL
ncbi:hypothetical protein SLEP1_g3861 [Rubroshorea leprosula]|uniref:RING-type domain-containing protein n=1 Tax=Rubroshorea leprosula TaxID=152421 RepID=A0AAV5HWH3_9ROSI|nr:hypothetical protein SLEP1_g3861 [Rubroshorea leprosula]